MPAARASHLTLPTILVGAIALVGCAEPADSTGLETMERTRAAQNASGAGAKSELGGETDGESKSEDSPPTTPDAISATPGDGEEPPPEERVALRFALQDGARYRITTIGGVKLPLVNAPTGFAREEELVLSACEGESAARSCLLTHTYRNYDAEPPAGRAMVKDEERVKALTTSYRVKASGLRADEGKVDGPKDALENEDAQQLIGLDRLYCIHLPEENVGVGATWTSSCRIRRAGMIATRTLRWQLIGLDADDDFGQRAELSYEGVHVAQGKTSERQGKVEGRLYWIVDAGEPHMMREKMAVSVSGKELVTETTARMQFAKVDPEDEEKILRADGKPFPDVRNLNGP